MTDDILDALCGVDEAGRGPLAGPVVAAAVILHPHRPIEGLADSKTLTPARRERLARVIRDQAWAWATASSSVEEIDRLNILQATLLAMERAVAQLSLRPSLILVDGNRLPRFARYPQMPARAVVRGDATIAAISAASILAKTERDAEMCRLHREAPEYGLDRHKGYGTAQHLSALARLGPAHFHRTSFAPVRQARTRQAILLRDGGL
jgi:ribonuclease HII